MALPSGVITKTVSAGRTFDLTGGAGKVTVVVTPDFGGANRLIWTATGEIMPNWSWTTTSTDGSSVSVDLPVVDQAGWVDPAGNTFTGWSYTVRVTLKQSSGTDSITYTQTVQPLQTSNSPIDLDTIPDGSVPAVAATTSPLNVIGQDASSLGSTWGAAWSSASFLDTASMGTLKALGAPAAALETENNGVTPVLADDGTLSCAAAAPATSYRSEAIFTSDRTDGANDYTVMRFTEGQRIRVAFDALTHGMNAQSSDNWNSLLQGLGKAINNSFGFASVTVQITNGQWRLQHGAGVDVGASGTHYDEQWVRWELDILLGRAGVGTVKAWRDGVSLGTWTPTAGTFYAGTGNNATDLQWIYFKNGLYGGATTSPIPVKALFRNRRFSVTTTGGSTTTWRGPAVSSGGLHLFRRNPVTDMPY